MKKNTVLGYLFFFAYLLCQNTSWADETACFDHASSSIEVLACNQQEIAELNARLQAVYKKVEREISENSIAGRDPSSMLRNMEISERSWKSSMEDSCSFSGSQRGGSPLWVNIFTAECEINEIKQRIDFYKAILSSPH